MEIESLFVVMLEAGSRQRTVAITLGATQSFISWLWSRYRSVADRHGVRSHITTPPDEDPLHTNYYLNEILH